MPFLRHLSTYLSTLTPIYPHQNTQKYTFLPRRHLTRKRVFRTRICVNAAAKIYPQNAASSDDGAFMARHFRDCFSAIHIAPLAFCLTRRTAKIVFLQGEPPTHFFHRSRCSRGDKTIERTLRKSRRVLSVTIKRNALPIIFFEKICTQPLDNEYAQKSSVIHRN